MLTDERTERREHQLHDRFFELADELGLGRRDARELLRRHGVIEAIGLLRARLAA